MTELLHRTNNPNIPRARRQIDAVFERHSEDGMGLDDAVLWKPLVKLWSDATVKRKARGDFEAVDVEATPVVPDNNFSDSGRSI